MLFFVSITDILEHIDRGECVSYQQLSSSTHNRTAGTPMTTEIYLDGNATSAVMPAAIAAANEAMALRYGNPSSTHATGLRARAMLDAVRACARRLLGVGDGRLMFNSGATEGIQTAMLSALCALRERRERGEAIGSLLLYGATEHKAVPESLAHWNRLLGLNLQLQALPVDAQGRHDLAALRGLAGQAALVCTMAANNETGVVSDLAGIEAALADSGAYWLVDCVQALGKLSINLAATRIDYAPFSGHKLYAPKGVGMLYVRAGAPFTPLMMGGGQETGQRSGTENMVGIAALGAVLAALEQGGAFRSHAELDSFRARLAASLRASLPGIVFNNAFELSLPTTLNFSVPGLASRELMDVFDAAGVRVSSGSACSAAKAAPSYVLDAMQLPLWRSSGAIRMSFGPLVDAATIADACARIERCGAALRASGLLSSTATADAAQDGVVQFGIDGACGWLVPDAASRSCVLIDPPPEWHDKIATYLQRQHYRVRALLSTTPHADHGALASLLAERLDSRARVDAYGWPLQDEGECEGGQVALDDGAAADCLPLGPQVLASVPTDAGAQRSYLLGAANGARLEAGAVRFAFSAHAAPAGLARLLTADALLCPTRDEHNQFCASRGAQAAATDADADWLVDAEALDAFLQAHPDTVLVDVREPYEFAAGGGGGPGGLPARSVPLGSLVAQAELWLRGTPAPLLFFCRSGARSAKAAHCLRRLGHHQAYSLRGGLALAPLTPLTPLALAA